MKIQVCDISGMGGREFGGYEWGCQVICARALRFLTNMKTESQFPKFAELQKVAGLCIADNERAREMDKYILQHAKLREFGMTGAMHQFALHHAMTIFTLGRDEYLREARAHRPPEHFFEFDDSDAFPEDLGDSGKGTPSAAPKDIKILKY